MPNSHFLAKLIGPTLPAIAGGMLINGPRYRAIAGLGLILSFFGYLR